MPTDVSFMQYMRAHGNTPGPTQRPYVTGAIAGLAAGIASAALLYLSGAAAAVANSLGVGLWAVQAFDLTFFAAAGLLYAFVFKRAANDRSGGWLFGVGYGFLLWMFAPVSLWQLTTGRPVAVGRDAAMLLAAGLLYGLLLGLIYPRVHSLVQKRLTASRRGQGREKAPKES